MLKKNIPPYVKIVIGHECAGLSAPHASEHGSRELVRILSEFRVGINREARTSQDKEAIKFEELADQTHFLTDAVTSDSCEYIFDGIN
jgi:hypothetical protein